MTLEDRKELGRIMTCLYDNINEFDRIAQIAANAPHIYNNIDAEFKRVTALNDADVKYVLWASVLQSLRWVVMQPLDLPRMEDLAPAILKSDRLGANERFHIGGIYDGFSSGSEYEHNALAQYLDSHKDIEKRSKDEFYKGKNQYRSWIEIIAQPVPYDAINGLDKRYVPDICGLNRLNPNGLFSNICGSNHHVATLGHDPILGWIFGTANIMTNTITYSNFRSYRVQQGHKIRSSGEFLPSNELLYSDQVVVHKYPCSIAEIFYDCMLSAREDYKRIPAAIAKQAMHFASDKYCIQGLPIPLLSTINAQKAQEMIEKGWNSVEFERLLKSDLKQIGTSAGISIFINLVIEAIYRLCAEDNYITETRIRKIISLSNTISSSSNVLYVAVSKNISKLDVGGIGVTAYELLHSEKIIRDIKEEYIRNHFEDIVMNRR